MCVNFTQDRQITDKGTSIEEMPLWDPSGRHSPGAIPGLVFLDSVIKQPEQAM